MIMASSAICSEAKECLTDDADQVFNFILSHRHLHLFVVRQSCVVRACDKEPSCRNRVEIVRLQNVAGQLQADKLIVRHVLIQGINHPVAVRPRVPAGLIVFKAVAFPETHDVQPVPRPAFAIMW